MRGYEYLRVRRQQVGVPQRRAALPAHRGDADAARRARRHPRRVLRQHGRRTLRRPARSSGCPSKRPRSTRRSSATAHRPASVTQDADLRRAAATINGLRLVDARASYGVGLETFALGFPVHFDWSWRTLFNQDWEDALFAAFGGSEEFRKPKCHSGSATTSRRLRGVGAQPRLPAPGFRAFRFRGGPQAARKDEGRRTIAGLFYVCLEP